MLTRGFDGPWVDNSKTIRYSFVCPAAICGLAEVGMDGCGHPYMDLAMF